jgi:hypothetical protein
LSESPDFSLSEAEEGIHSAIFRAFRGAALENGIFVVAHAGPELIYLDSTGATVHTWRDAEQEPARPGRVGALFSAGDEVGVWESARRTVWWYSERGEHLGNLRVPSYPGELVLAPGYLPGIGIVVSSEPRPREPRTGEPRRYRVYDREGEEVAVLEGPPEPPPSVISDGTTPGYGLSAACAARPYEAALGAELFAADAAAGILFAIDVQGGVREVFRAQERLPMTRLHLDSIRSWIDFSEGGDLSPALEAALARIGSVGDPQPAWTGIITDPTGRLWLRRQECYGDFQAFDIVRSTGEFEGSVEVPGDYTVISVYGDRVLVVRRDMVGVEHVEQYRIVR